MITKSSPIKHRILIEKIHADGHKELIGDSKFEPVYDKDKILLLLKLMEIDIERKNKIMESLKEE